MESNGGKSNRWVHKLYIQGGRGGGGTNVPPPQRSPVPCQIVGGASIAMSCDLVNTLDSMVSWTQSHDAL